MKRQKLELKVARSVTKANDFDVKSFKSTEGNDDFKKKDAVLRQNINTGAVPSKKNKSKTFAFSDQDLRMEQEEKTESLRQKGKPRSGGTLTKPHRSFSKFNATSNSISSKTIQQRMRMR